ncbi:MAG TPA: hypothetical protein VGD54_09670 [Steroidobacteraceae bacterium]
MINKAAAPVTIETLPAAPFINGGKIARADAAQFVVDQLTTDTWLRRTLVILW